MAQQNFILIEEYLHFIDNTTLTLEHSRRAKTVPIFDYLVDTFSYNYKPGRDVYIDESLLLWKECLSQKQYILQKLSSFRLKSFVLSQAESGYIWKSIFCPGNDTKYVDGCEFQYSATKNAFSLAKDQLNQGYCIYVDDWYTSLEQCANS